jgi:hypothetical protein
MGAIKAEFTEIQGEMFDVAETLNRVAEEGDFDEMMVALVENTAKLAVITRRYHELHS